MFSSPLISPLALLMTSSHFKTYQYFIITKTSSPFTCTLHFDYLCLPLLYFITKEFLFLLISFPNLHSPFWLLTSSIPIPCPLTTYNFLSILITCDSSLLTFSLSHLISNDYVSLFITYDFLFMNMSCLARVHYYTEHLYPERSHWLLIILWLNSFTLTTQISFD